MLTDVKRYILGYGHLRWIVLSASNWDITAVKKLIAYRRQMVISDRCNEPPKGDRYLRVSAATRNE